MGYGGVSVSIPDNVTSEMKTFGTILKKCEIIAEAKINTDKLVGLLLVIWRGSSVLSHGVVRCRTD